MRSSSLGNAGELHPRGGDGASRTRGHFQLCERVYFVVKESSHLVFPGESRAVPEGPPNGCWLQPGPLTVMGRHHGGKPGNTGCSEMDGGGFIQAASHQFVIHTTWVWAGMFWFNLVLCPRYSSAGEWVVTC